MNDSDYQGLIKRLNEHSGLREEFRTILGLLMAGDDDALLAIGDRGWNHWPSLEDDILGWMVDNLRKESGFKARQQRCFALGPRMVSVEVQHLRTTTGGSGHSTRESMNGTGLRLRTRPRARPGFPQNADIGARTVVVTRTTGRQGPPGDYDPRVGKMGTRVEALAAGASGRRPTPAHGGRSKCTDGNWKTRAEPRDWGKQHIRRGGASAVGFSGVAKRREQPPECDHHRGAEGSTSHAQSGHPGDEMGGRRPQQNGARPQI